MGKKLSDIDALGYAKCYAISLKEMTQFHLKCVLEKLANSHLANLHAISRPGTGTQGMT